MNEKFLTAVKRYENKTLTQNGAIAYKSTLNKVLDLFAFGAAYRNRTDEECIRLFSEAYYEDSVYAIKCLFYIRDVREGQGERRFFRTCIKWLAENHPTPFMRNVRYIPMFGRWDDLLCLLDTPLKDYTLELIRAKWKEEVGAEMPESLFFKWMPSINASSTETKRYARIIRKYLKISEKEYRITLSEQRKKINVLEKLMSNGEWDKIEFDKLPSKAGMKYRNAFRNREELAERYAEFMSNKKTKVNAGVLYPYDIVRAARKVYAPSSTEVQVVNKYWDNLKDYFDGCSFDGIPVVDVSGSMMDSSYGNVLPIDVSVSLGLYCADKCSGPFKNHFFTFSEEPELVEIQGDNFYQKVNMMLKANWGYSTNVEAVFDEILSIAKENNLSREDLPKNLLIISDMQFDSATRYSGKPLFDDIESRWKENGYEMPHLIYWNVNASTNIIPNLTEGHVSFVSGCSPVILEQVLKGKEGIDICMDKLNKERYKDIY